MAEGFKVLVFVAGVGVRGNHNPSRPARRWREREREGARERERERESERARERWGGKGGKGGAGGGEEREQERWSVIAGIGITGIPKEQSWYRTRIECVLYRMCSLGIGITGIPKEQSWYRLGRRPGSFWPVRGSKL